jgi:hypothetical protein
MRGRPDPSECDSAFKCKQNIALISLAAPPVRYVAGPYPQTIPPPLPQRPLFPEGRVRIKHYGMNSLNDHTSVLISKHNPLISPVFGPKIPACNPKRAIL